MSTTIIGRLVADPDIKFTNAGNAVVNFSVAVNRKRGEDEYVSYFDCTAWGTLAQGIADSLHKGDRVIVNGSLTQDRYEKDGKTLGKVILNAEAVGPELRFATAQVTSIPFGSKKKEETPEEAF
jgi:single-strand DNA-binding protein